MSNLFRNYTVIDCIGIALAYAVCAIYLLLLVAAFPFALLWLWLGNLPAPQGIKQ